MTTRTKAKKKKAKAKKKKAPARKAVPARRGLRVEYVPLGELEAWPRNPKRHDAAGIAGSIRRFGFTLPVVVDERTGRLVAGHGRQEALSAMREAGEGPPKNIRARGGEWLVPVVRGNEFESEEEAERYLIADNRFVELGGWDPAELSAMLEGLEPEDLAAVGFDQAELDRLLKMAEAAEPVDPPSRFVQFEASDVKTNHKCPSCGYEWNE